MICEICQVNEAHDKERLVEFRNVGAKSLAYVCNDCFVRFFPSSEGFRFITKEERGKQ